MQEYLLLFLLGIPAGIFLLSSQFSYKKQSFLLGLGGALGGGIIASIVTNGIQLPNAPTMLFITLLSVGLLMFIRSVWSPLQPK